MRSLRHYKCGFARLYGVPALAGRVLVLEGGSNHWEIHDEAASDRLKPGLHTWCPSFAREIGRLRAIRTAWSLVFCVSALRIAAGVAPGEDWAQFLGPHGDGTSAESGLLDRWPTNGPPVVWDRKVGTGYGAPSVRDNRLVLHHRVGEEEVIEAWAADSGRPVWRYAYPSHFVDPYEIGRAHV